MNDKLQRIFRQLLINIGPYIILGIAIACIMGLFILSYYMLLWGLMIGFILWLCALFKRYFLSEQPPAKKNKGRIIDHDTKK